MKPAEGCYLFGVYKACIGIKDAVILFHSITGCHMGTLIYHMNNDLEDVRQACSVIYEQDIVYGGTKQLSLALQNLEQLYSQAKLVIIISGCIPNMIGDDVTAEIKKTGIKVPVVHIAAAGTDGSERDGYEDALMTLAQFIEPDVAIKKGLVNIIGLSADDPRIESDIAELKNIIGPELSVQTVCGLCTFDEFRNMSRAELNIVFGSGSSLAKMLEKEFGIPYIAAEYPYGMVGLKALQQKITSKLPKIDYSVHYSASAEILKPQLKKITHFLNCLYSIPVAVIGDGVRTAGLKRFLADELGMNVVFYCDSEMKDLNLQYDAVRKSNAVILFGSSFQRGLAEEMKIPLINFCYPVFDQIVLGNKPFVGQAGILNILECLINGCLLQKHKPDGAYAELRRQLGKADEEQ